METSQISKPPTEGTDTQKEESKENAALQNRKEEQLSDSEDSDCEINEIIRQRRVNADLYSVIDQKLSNIVLIEKQMMEEWRKQQEQIKLDMEKENNTVESSLRREKYLYETNIAQMEREKSD